MIKLVRVRKPDSVEALPQSEPLKNAKLWVQNTPVGRGADVLFWLVPLCPGGSPSLLPKSGRLGALDVAWCCSVCEAVV